MPKTDALRLIATTPASHFGTSEPAFLWKPWLPYKKLCILQGESGIGKSSFILHIASLLSNGEPMPFDEHSSEAGDILYFNKEDDIEETINPRLIAMGANRDRFHFVSESFYLDDDCKRLEATINELNARLVIFDPLTTFLSGKHNMNTAQSVGNLMRALSRAAFNTGAAIVVVCHLVKNASGKEIDRHLGSSDIINAARSVLSATRDSGDSDIVTVKHLKSTLAKRARPFQYELIGNGVLQFYSDDEYDLFDDDAPAAKKDRAKDMLMQILSEGARPQQEIRAMFERMNICGWRTVETAKSELGIEQVYRDGGVSYWCLQ